MPRIGPTSGGLSCEHFLEALHTTGFLKMSSETLGIMCGDHRGSAGLLSKEAYGDYVGTSPYCPSMSCMEVRTTIHLEAWNALGLWVRVDFGVQCLYGLSRQPPLLSTGALAFSLPWSNFLIFSWCYILQSIDIYIYILYGSSNYRTARHNLFFLPSATYFWRS